MIHHPLPHHPCIAIAGVGSAGSAAARLLAPFAQRLIAVDARADFPALPDGVECRPASHAIDPATALILSPGLNPEWPSNRDNPLLRPWWDAWRSGQLEVLGEVELAARALPIPWLTVGGTDGKSTTAALAAHLLTAFAPGTVLGGNSWTAISEVIRQNPAATAAVVEVSAFQLQQPHGLRPRSAILTNIAPDHLDHYDGYEAYIAAKHHIWRNMGAGDALALHATNEPLMRHAGAMQAQGIRVGVFDVERPAGHWQASAWLESGILHVETTSGSLRLRRDALPAPGPHNTRNLLAALLGIDGLVPGLLQKVGAEALEARLASFRGLAHRVEWVRDRAGVRWYNDSKATNVHAALTGIRAFEAPLVAIVGGVDKQLDLAPLIDALAERKARVLVIGEITERLMREAAGRFAQVEAAETLQAAVQRAAEWAASGDVVLLAPACSSFDQFRSFEHRGEVFAEAVRALPEPG
jgi:UDP-N-acetylmuramoylalanine--D-glutamate ligase